MDKTTGAIIAASVGELLTGATIGIICNKHVFPHCNKGEAIVAYLGMLVGAFCIGRRVNKTICEACDERFESEACKVMGYK